MANGQFNLGKQSGGVLSISFPDGVSNTEVVLPESGTLATKEATVDIYNSHIPMSNFASYHLLDGNLSVDNFVITQGMNTTLYTGNGSTQSINTGIDMDTQWGDTAEEKFGGLVWQKYRSTIGDNTLIDSVRGAGKFISSNTTGVQGTDNNSLSSFTSNGFNIGTSWSLNGATAASWNFQTTHRRTGVTNHGKPYTCHYNPFTGFTMVKYTGSGIAGHEIPHHLGRKLDIAHFKNLSTVQDWLSFYGSANKYLALNLTIASTTDASVWTDGTSQSFVFNGGGTQFNQSGSQHIMYGWANSYFDESDKLIGNYEIGVYQGTGASGNKVKTRGKPAWVMIKRLDSTGSWCINDIQRGALDYILYPNLSVAEYTSLDIFDVSSDGFIIKTTNADLNASGGQYLYMVAYDTNSDGGGGYYNKSTDNANVQVNNAIIPLAKGIDSNGIKNEIVIANETITGVTWEDGKNYPYKTYTGYGKSIHRPRYLKSELIRTYAGEQPDYFDVEKNKWFSCDAGSELIVNGDFSSGVTTGWTAVGSTLSIVNNTLKVVTVSGYGLAQQAVDTEAGKKYKIKFTLSARSNTQAGLYLDTVSGVNSGNYIYNTGIFLAVGTYEVEFIAQNSVTYLKLLSENASGYYTQWDNISVFPVEITPTTEIPESRNYMNHIVHADSQGNPLFVEELQKIKYENVIKAEEYQGKNACTAWVNFDGTTTPVTIRDSYNVSKVIRTTTGIYDIYFENEMNNTNYSCSISVQPIGSWNSSGDAEISGFRTVNKAQIQHYEANVLTNTNNASIHFFGGKN